MDFSFFQTPTLDLCRNLLGMTLIHESDEGRTAGKIVEVEAYMGPEDKAAHSFGGRRTNRTEVMYGPPGFAYVYLIYGLHYCFNIVSGPVHKPEAILIRAIEPVEGMDIMIERRGLKNLFNKNGEIKQGQIKNLTNGPGKLADAMGITIKQYGLSLANPPLYLQHPEREIDDSMIETGPRINIEYAEEAVSYPWRFWIKDNAFVSK
ncbi:DNA-3-methyladenine glycosylase [Pseudalkalibacillus caeni]|uniref:Putative 3-methyladenine DNA glycosylase n=1 Tax=Exobacillus caeni TaxID=2574798 RepID=A0A5R9F643_9BACL|nr:DNA-3-methyladenine glycosylase [Pseudalkalibacillus caeni]TLS39017.1 DNA-3-methyladenine glycosylase [Pseudalkalibacillus caeni]